MKVLQGEDIIDVCRLHKLGLIEYNAAAQLQDNLVSLRLGDEIPDTLLLLQHSPVLTIGASGGKENITVPEIMLEGMPVVCTDRGGNITCHEPGQLVGYPILDLKSRNKDLHQYVRNIEETVIRTLNDFAVSGYRDARYPGVWVEGEKICSLGIRVRQWVTKHGFALNINNDLNGFTFIYPCGINGIRATSLSHLLERQVSIEEVIPCLLAHFAEVFQVNVQESELSLASV